MSLYEELKYKNLIKDIASENEFINKLNSKQMTVYVGMDMTAPSIHIGNLVQLKILQLFLKYNHKVIFLFGSATTRIGDPSDKNELRKMLSDSDIENNKKNILHCIKKFIDLNNPNVQIVDNYDWMKSIHYIDFLKEIGIHFTINKMINIEFVKKRIENELPITFLEMNYMLMQGYDFWHLYTNYGCNVQFGGSDQWGNILQGIELIKRKNHQAEVFGFTVPLLINSKGEKMGKSVNGAIWIHEDMLEPYQYFQFFRNVSDEDVIKLLKIFSNLSQQEIEKYSEYKFEKLNEVKEILAFEATKECHGEENAIKCLEKSKGFFCQFEVDEKDKIEVQSRTLLLDFLFNQKIVESRGELKRLFSSGAIKIGNEKILNDKLILNKETLKSFNSDIISVGKKNKIAIKIIE